MACFQESSRDIPVSSAKIQTLDGRAIARGWIELAGAPIPHSFSPENAQCVWDTRSYSEVIAVTEDGQEVHLYAWECCPEQPPGVPSPHFHYRLEK